VKIKEVLVLPQYGMYIFQNWNEADQLIQVLVAIEEKNLKKELANDTNKLQQSELMYWSQTYIEFLKNLCSEAKMLFNTHRTFKLKFVGQDRLTDTITKFDVLDNVLPVTYRMTVFTMRYASIEIENELEKKVVIPRELHSIRIKGLLKRSTRYDFDNLVAKLSTVIKISSTGKQLHDQLLYAPKANDEYSVYADDLLQICISQ